MTKNASKKMICFVVISALLIATALISGCDSQQEISNDEPAGTNISTISTEAANKEDDSSRSSPMTGNNALEADIEIISFESDKKDYGSHEDIHFSALIRSSDDVKGITLIVRGIRPYNQDHISVAKTDDLAKGDNDASFSAKTPYCTSGCGGVYPGEYQITLELFSGDELLASKSLAINLKS